ncbi:sensor domain-containing protein [Thiocapsa imhoffii]|nr:EAL domain-containing protein [Thiocapsa imhoffii]
MSVLIVHQAAIDIPSRTRAQQEMIASALLERLAAAIPLELDEADTHWVERLLALERLDLQVLELDLIADAPGEPVGTFTSTQVGWFDGDSATRSNLLDAARTAAMQPQFATLTEPRRLLAIMALGDPPATPSPSNAAPPPLPVVSLVMELAAIEAAQRRQLLAWTNPLIWLFAAALVLSITLITNASPHQAGTSTQGGRTLLNRATETPLHGVRATDAFSQRLADLEHILDIAAVVLVGIDARGHVRLVNRKACLVLGLARDQIIGRDWVDTFIPERERPRTRHILANLIDVEQADHAELISGIEGALLCADGSERLIEWNNSRILDPAGHIIGALGSGTDITERKQAERALSYLVTLETVLVETSRSLVAAPADAVGPVVENALGAVARRMHADRAYVFVLSRDGLSMRNTHEWSASGLGLMNESSAPRVPTSLIPRWMETLQYGDDIRIDDVARLPETWRVDREQLEQLEVRAVAAVALRVAGRLGGFVAIEMVSEPRVWRDSEMRALGFLGDLIGGAFERRRNELKLIESRRKLEEIALYDPLTRLPNRRLLAERMDEAVAQARERGDLLGVCYLDLDGFKPINDTLGHKMGDRVLMTVASRLRACVGEQDTVARLGGDEFVLLMTHLESLSDCAAGLERVLASLAQPILIDGETLGVTGSLGATLFPQDAGDADTLLRHADHAMYQAKQQGRNRYQFFKSLDDPSDQAQKAELSRIRTAIEGHELRLHVQPRVDMRSGQIVGVEALVRWEHPERGLLPAREFVPLMKGDELLKDLDWWVMEHALELLEAWQQDHPGLSMSLNLSGCTLDDPAFITRLQDVLARHPTIAPARLQLEIVESEALHDVETTASVIRACAVLDVRFALDGFGNGYASLTDFRCLPAQIVKIDQVVVRDILRSRDDRCLVEGVIGIAHAFEREVVAEGVESAMHGLLLMDLGCRLAQGYGIAEPMPPEQLRAWMTTYAVPYLWNERPKVDWTVEDLTLLSLEALVRGWVKRLIRSASSDPAARPLEPRAEASEFSAWLAGEGKTRYSDRPNFIPLETSHQRLCEQASLLLEASRFERSAAVHRIPALFQQRDALIQAIQALQQDILEDRDRHSGRIVRSQHSAILEARNRSATQA